MKKVIKYFGVVLFCFLLTGCYDYKMEMSINDDKSLSFILNIEMDVSDYLNELSVTSEDEITFRDYTGIDEAAILSLQERGFEVLEEKDGYKYSILVRKDYKSIDEVSSDEDVRVNFDEIIDSSFKEIYYKVEKNEYTSNFLFDMKTEDVDLSKDYKDLFQMDYRLKIGKSMKVLKNNATSVSEDKKEYVWKLNLGEENLVYYTVAINNNMNIYLLFMGMIILLVVLNRRKGRIKVKYARRENRKK